MSIRSFSTSLIFCLFSSAVFAGETNGTHQSGAMQSENQCPIYESKNWRAVLTLQGEGQAQVLHVTGQVVAPTSNYSFTWKEGPIDRRNPPTLRLKLIATPPEGIQLQAIQSVDVAYSAPALAPRFSAILVICGDRMIAEIGKVTNTDE